MFNLQSLVAMASQAMLKKLISSDSMYSQWNTFCKKWGLPQTSMGIVWGCKNYNIYDLYYTLNMVRSDYYKDGQAPQYYADLAFDFLEDKDAPEGKAKRYYLAMHCTE